MLRIGYWYRGRTHKRYHLLCEYRPDWACGHGVCGVQILDFVACEELERLERAEDGCRQCRASSLAAIERRARAMAGKEAGDGD